MPLTALLAGLLLAAAASAAELYVDNVRGRDAFDGMAEQAISLTSGPVRTLRRAALLAGTGDTIILIDNGIPYHDTLELNGPRNSGRRFASFTVLGNGAVLDGSCPVPAGAWRPAGDGVWTFTPWRKGHFQLILDDVPVPEHPCPPGAPRLPDIPAGHWCAWRGAIYLRPGDLEEPGDLAYRFACRGTGISLVDVDNVRIADLTVRHFRLNGVGLNGLCRNVVLENVRLEGHGRAGVAAAGVSRVAIRGSGIAGNRRHSVLVLERAAVEVDDQSELDVPPTLAD